VAEVCIVRGRQETEEASAADLQRGTYSKYYAGNCFKGGIFIQLCGWLGVHDLWGGNVSDTNYNKKAGYLEEQESYHIKSKIWLMA